MHPPEKKIRVFGLIGSSLDHSFSPKYFKQKFEKEGITDAVYQAFPLNKIAEIIELINQELSGLNVTIPYKEHVIPYINELKGDAIEVKAVNTLVFKNDMILGYNTDTYGFEQSLLEFTDRIIPPKALILGSGGASKAIQFVLRKNKVDYLIVSRKGGDLNYFDIDKKIIDEHHLIINSTPLGMGVRVDDFPDLPYHYLGEKHYLFDLIYNPEKTLFLEKGELNGSRILNGYRMLCLQAEKSWELWNKE